MLSKNEMSDKQKKKILHFFLSWEIIELSIKLPEKGFLQCGLEFVVWDWDWRLMGKFSSCLGSCIGCLAKLDRIIICSP